MIATLQARIKEAYVNIRLLMIYMYCTRLLEIKIELFQKFLYW